MHNVNVEAVEQTAAKASQDPAAMLQHVTFDGEWQTADGAPQFRATIPVPNGEAVRFEADFPPPMGGTGSAPNPLAYCFWGASPATPRPTPRRPHDAASLCAGCTRVWRRMST